MLFYTSLLLLVIAVSLDGFGVGITYGMQKIRVPFFPLCIIMLCSGIVVLLSMTIGNILSSMISPHIAQMFGGCILIILGGFSFVKMIHSSVNKNENGRKDEVSEKRLHQFKTVLSTPDKADWDQSGAISANEALLLGAALALDAFGAGLAAAVIGYSPLLTSTLIALMSGTFVYCGMKLGIVLSENKYMQKMTFIPPLLLISLGIYNLF